MGTRLELPEYGFRFRHCVADAAEAAAGTSGGPDQLFRACFAILFLFCDLHFIGAAGNRSAPDELLLSGVRVFCVPSVAGVPCGPRIDSCRVCDLGDRVGRVGGQLLTAGGQHTLRDSRIRSSAAHLSGSVFVRILFRRLHRLGGDDRCGSDAVCGDADDRKDPLAREIQSRGFAGRPDGSVIGTQLGNSRPGFAPVALASAQTSVPLTQTFSMPVASSNGCLKVERSMTVFGLKRTRSA